MNQSAQTTLIGLGIPKELIHIEQFGTVNQENNGQINAVENAELHVKLNGKEYLLTIPKGKTVLQVLKDAKLNPPYSCESGVCATCVAKIIKGKVEMKSCMALDDEDIKKGMVLTCQSYPTSDSVHLEF